MKVDSATNPGDLVHAWTASGRVFAVTVGSLVALTSHMVNAPIHIASFRGALAFAVVRGLTALGCWLVPRVVGPEGLQPEGEPFVEGAEASKQ